MTLESCPDGKIEVVDRMQVRIPRPRSQQTGSILQQAGGPESGERGSMKRFRGL